MGFLLGFFVVPMLFPGVSVGLLWYFHDISFGLL